MHYNYTIIPINSQLALSPFIASNVLTEECSYLFMSEFMLHQLCVFFIYSFGALPSTCSLKMYTCTSLVTKKAIDISYCFPCSNGATFHCVIDLSRLQLLPAVICVIL